ncbi:DUF202 domain-containing protein [Nocardia sp. NPDC019395]|uniref:DUF202 domain-containing protein n=1 Tax=Nocardia sp. NPDC019395 TaxID=3154686 RepID=UPI0033F4F1ED
MGFPDSEHPERDSGLQPERTRLARFRTALSVLAAGAMMLRVLYEGGGAGAALWPAAAAVGMPTLILLTRSKGDSATADGLHITIVAGATLCVIFLALAFVSRV